MRFKRLDLNLLAALDVLMRRQSVSKAAEEMFLTQSAMSNALGRLRSFFDDELLVQVGRRMELTPFAQTLQEPLRDIMMRIEGTVLVEPRFDPQTSSRVFSIMLSDYSLAVLGGPLLRRIALEAPHVIVRLRPQVATPARLLERGEVDLLIAPEFVMSDTHEQELLFEDPLVVLTCAAGAYADGISAEQFACAQQVVMEPYSSQRSFASVALNRASINRVESVSTYAFTSIPDLLIGTDRIGIVQGRLAQRAVAGGRVRMHPVPVDLPPLRQFMQWHQHRARDAGLQWLRDIVRDCASCTETEPLM